MREILFRGQTRKLGEKVRMNGEKVPSNWVYGGIFPGTGDYSIIYGIGEDIEKYTVYSDTVGQYTGLTDKNGKKIFEGDIVRIGDITHDGQVQISGKNFLVDMQRACWIIEHCPDWDFLCTNARSCEVVGNIHDNPELLEVSEDE